MKKYLSILMVAILAVFASCSKDDDDKTIYTVMFETDGGIPVPSIQKVEAGDMVATPSVNPVKTGYAFVFWHLTGTATAYNFQSPVNNNITLCAKWQEEATAEYWQVTWNLNGGVWPSGDNHATQVLKSGVLAEPSEPTKNGYTFEGWYKEPALINKVIFPYDVSDITSNFTLYAKWMVGDGGEANDPNLERAIYSLGYAANVADQYNNRGLKPNNILISGTTNDVAADVRYSSNGALDYIYTFILGGGGSIYSAVYYIADMGRRLGITVRSSSINSTKETAIAARTNIRSGSYDYANDPEKVIAYFGSWMGNSVFTSLDNLKLITNNSAITEKLYNSMSFSNNCYKMIVFGNNRSGELIGKYVGYSTNGKIYICWCIDPESPSFGERMNRNTPYK